MPVIKKLKTQSSVSVEFFEKVVHSLQLLTIFANSFVHRRLADFKYISGTSFAYEVILAIDDFSSKS